MADILTQWRSDWIRRMDTGTNKHTCTTDDWPSTKIKSTLVTTATQYGKTKDNYLAAQKQCTMINQMNTASWHNSILSIELKFQSIWNSRKQVWHWENGIAWVHHSTTSWESYIAVAESD